MNQDDKDLVEEKFKGVTTLINAQFQAQNVVLEGINSHLARLNGKVAEHEMQIAAAILERERNRQAQHDYVENRATACPHLPRIQALETQDKISISKKQLIITSLSVILVVVSILSGVMRLNSELRQKEMRQIMKSDSTMIQNQVMLKAEIKSNSK